MVRIVLLLGVLSLSWVGCGDDDGTDTNNNNQGNTNSNGDCGDGVVDDGEACDDGGGNSDTVADACRSDCRSPYCGDGVADSVEECDDGGDNDDTLPDGCRTDCRAAHCADGVLDSADGCDDGNDVAGDGCAPDCTVEDHWACDGSPSVCGCADYYWRSDCSGCAVRVNADALGTVPTGASWEAAFTTIQEGTAVAESLGSGCEVWVAGGTYHIWETSAADTLDMRSGVSLYGGFAGTEEARDERDWHANPTVLEGMREGSSVLDGDNVEHVVTAYETTDATLDGFVVTGGNATYGGSSETGSGGGMFAYQLTGSVDVVVANCVFHDNRAERYGGAISVSYGSLRVVSSTFYGNEVSYAGGAIASPGSGSITVADSTFSHNVVISGSATIGSGGGIYADNASNLSVSSSVFFANLVLNPGSPAVARGAGLHGDGTGAVRNCTFVINVAGNTSSSAGSAIYETGEVTNCVFSANSAYSVASGGSVSFSQLESSLVGPGNSTENPRLVRLPLSIHLASYWGDMGLSMPDPSVLAVGDVIEVNNDGVLRTVTDHPGPNFVSFTPAGAQLRAGFVVVENWGPGASTVDEDLSLQASSPCIDTALDSVAPATDILGYLRVDVPGVGTTGTLSDRGAFEYQP